MVSHLFYYQLALLALVWLFVMLHVTWPKRGALCERDAAHPQAPLPVPPDSMPSTNRRPRQVDTSMHFCPHTGCDYRGWLGLGNLRANGHPSGGPCPPLCSM